MVGRDWASSRSVIVSKFHSPIGKADQQSSPRIAMLAGIPRGGDADPMNLFEPDVAPDWDIPSLPIRKRRLKVRARIGRIPIAPATPGLVGAV